MTDDPDDGPVGQPEPPTAADGDTEAFASLVFPYWAPIDSRVVGEEPEYDNDLTVALRRLLELMWNLRYDSGRLASARPAYDRTYTLRFDTGYGAAMLFRTGEHTVHVVGDSEVADRTRQALAAGSLRRWTLHPVPGASTQLRVLQSTLTTRYYGVLSRNDFLTVEEVDATPDAGLIDLHGAGRKFITAVRTAIADLSLGQLADLSINAPSPAEDSATRRQQLLDHLDPGTALRNRDLVELLVRSSIPGTGLKVIAQALDAEPAPPADPHVVALLDTAGEAAVLGYYTGTRSNGPTPP